MASHHKSTSLSNFSQNKDTNNVDNSPEAVVAPPGLWTTTHLRVHLGHFFILGNSTVSCRLLPCCSGSTTGAALPLAELGRWAVEVGSAGNCPGQPGTSHTSPPTTYPPPHLSTGAIKPRILIQTYALAQKLILKAQRPKNPGGLVALPSRKFLRVTLEIALRSFRTIWKFSG